MRDTNESPTRSLVRTLAGMATVACLAIAAYLAFDWADLGLDSTCGNLIRRKSAVGPCADIVRHRLIGVIVLVTLAIVLAVVAAWPARAVDST